MKRPINHLAGQIEQLAHYPLPFAQQITELQQLTTTIRQAWQILLPESIRETLTVTNHDGVCLSIATTHYTLANHLTYSRQPLLAELKQNAPQLQHIAELRFRVVNAVPKSPANPSSYAGKLGQNELSETTRRTIAQLAELVTDAPELQSALQKLIK